MRLDWFIEEDELAAREDVLVERVRAWRRSGCGPAPVRLGPGRYVYFEIDVAEWKRRRQRECST